VSGNEYKYGVTMIQLDGSTGEGGGQILRTALGLSLVTGLPFTIANIRANRKKPGLMRQHLTAVRAAAEIGCAEIIGDEIGSDKLIFKPREPSGGKYTFSIGTAGSCTLVFQAILPALLMAKEPSEIIIEGGTHNPHAPPFDFIQQTFLPILAEMGGKVTAKLVRPGFYPAGGGCMEFTIIPSPTLKPIELLHLSNPVLSARAFSAQLPEHIGKRELKVIKSKLQLDDEQLENIQINSYGPGNIVTISVQAEQLTETFTGFGEKNVSAERVGSKVAKRVQAYLANGAPVGPFLADQILIPLALAGSGCFHTGRPSNHTLTNIEVIQRFLKVEFALSEVDETCWEIRVV
jgi:RNA 3'-terminal phosphate cyclase (ATP)